MWLHEFLEREKIGLKNKESGFTLLEILIALFIFAIVSTIMVAALHNVITAQSATEKNAARFAEIQLALIIMSRDFEQVIDRPIINATNELDNPFIGAERTATFTHAGLANPMEQLQQSTLQRTRYRIERNNLVRDTWQVLDQTSKTVPISRTLLHNVTDLSFEYLDQKDKFNNRWPPAEQTPDSKLPRAVRVFLTLGDLGKLSQLYLIPGQPLEQHR